MSFIIDFICNCAIIFKMIELDSHKRSGVTKRGNSLGAFLNAADEVFADVDYRSIDVRHIVHNSGKSEATFYNLFPGKSAWAAAVLDKQLNQSLDQETRTRMATPLRTETRRRRRVPHSRPMARRKAPRMACWEPARRPAVLRSVRRRAC